ncbi:hypothetical protein GWK16_05010 [Roseomonas sp. JC162]|uniref:Lipoprotein n=1 Tax=Neoroseomonas marina TaxID=1232220 RepID=A0A848EAK0_9PROT|nr:hypothetical protein [Neoroseomonas marina]NMJ40587.1 hypothetical protein [Neoroseomonas marina]
MPHFARRTLAGSMLGLLALAGCASDLPETPPPADAVPGPGLYALSPGTPADGTVRVTIPRTGGTARGVLNTNGQNVRFTITGLGTQGPAPARVQVTGNVYGLQRVGDFAGTYRAVGGAATDLGAAFRIGNDNLVLMVLRPTPDTVVLTVPADGAAVAVQP